MSCWARNGTASMYVNTNEGLRPLATDDKVLLEALDVFGGDLRNLAPSSSFWANPPRAQQGDGRPALSRATTWRTSAPRLAHEDSKEDLDV